MTNSLHGNMLKNDENSLTVNKLRIEMNKQLLDRVLEARICGQIIERHRRFRRKTSGLPRGVVKCSHNPSIARLPRCFVNILTTCTTLRHTH